MYRIGNENIVICDHPLVKHKISTIRDKSTGTNEFRTIVSEIAMLIGYEALRNIELEDVEVETPLEKAMCPMMKGEKPAIDYGLSVSRLGGNVQASDMKKVGSKVRIELLSYLDIRQIYELANIDEMSEEIQRKLRDGKVILENLKQYKFSPKSKEEMMNSYKFITDRDTK